MIGTVHCRVPAMISAIGRRSRARRGEHHVSRVLALFGVLIAHGQKIAGLNRLHGRNQLESVPALDLLVVMPGQRTPGVKPGAELIVGQAVGPAEQGIGQSTAIGPANAGRCASSPRQRIASS